MSKKGKMNKKIEILATRIKSDYEDEIEDGYLRIYKDYDDEIRYVLALLHQKVNSLIQFMNSKSGRSNHYNAHESRELISVINYIKQLLRLSKGTDFEISLIEEYESQISYMKSFLKGSSGSKIPEDYQTFDIYELEEIFHISDKDHYQKADSNYQNLIMLGEGSYSYVYKITDESYGIELCLKRLKKDVEEKDKQRFKHEYDFLERVSFPYIREVFKYDSKKNEYLMEYCDQTLKDYIKYQNQDMEKFMRFRIAEQFLYAMNYLHSKGICHRDLSSNNILVKKYDGAVMIKLSDFGLSKEMGSVFTDTNSSIKGTKVDPTLESFEAFSFINDIYAVGEVLRFIFSGKDSGGLRDDNPYTGIVQKCMTLNLDIRYQNILQIFEDMQKVYRSI